MVEPRRPQRLSVSLQCGASDKNELSFNIHIALGIESSWNVTYKYSQLATLDHDVSTNCDQMKDVTFPLIDEKVTARLTGNSLSIAVKLKEVNRYRELLEIWVQQVISRSHTMPDLLSKLVEDWFCLPNGPTGESAGGRQLSTADAELLKDLQFAALRAQDEREREVVPSSSGPPLTSANSKNSKSKWFGKDQKIAEAEREKEEEARKQKEADKFVMKVRVQRGQRGRSGRVEYDIQIEHTARQRPYIVSRSYSMFRKLHMILLEVHAAWNAECASAGKSSGNATDVILTEFPLPPVRSFFGLALSEEHLSYRTRQLDAWLRDVMCSYCKLSNMERTAVRHFLDFELSSPVDIRIQDRMARGLVEAPRANIFVARAFLLDDAPGGMNETYDDFDDSKSIRNVAEKSIKEGKKVSEWETSSLASSRAPAGTIGKGQSFRSGGVKGGNSHAVEQLVHQASYTSTSSGASQSTQPITRLRRYSITNRILESEKDEDEGEGDGAERDDDDKSEVNEYDLGEDFLDIGGGAGGGSYHRSRHDKHAKNLNDQYIEEKFNSKDSCIIV